MTSAVSTRSLYTLIIAQLLEDGFHDVALQLSTETGIPMAAAPGVPEEHRADPAAVVCPGRLLELIERGLAKERALVGGKRGPDDAFGATTVFGGVMATDEEGDATMPVRFGVARDALPALDLAAPADGTPPPTQFTTGFVTTHKGAVLVSRFSRDGGMALTGSADSSIKLMDVSKARDYNEAKRAAQEAGLAAPSSSGSGPGHVDMPASTKPLIATYYEHDDAVTDVDFHPFRPLFVSGSDDCTVRYWDIRSKANRRAVQMAHDRYPVQAVAFHPGGDFVLVATHAPVVRLYDAHTNKCYGRAGDAAFNQHLGPLTSTCWAPEASVFATGSEDGSVKLWDGQTAGLVRTLRKAHGGARVHSVQFSRSGKYLLTSGADDRVHLWDVASGSRLQGYGLGKPSKEFRQQQRAVPCFSSDEQFVLIAEHGKGYPVVMWSTRTAVPATRHPGHSNHVNHLSASPVHHAFISTSDDHRARYWFEDQTSSNAAD